MCPSSAAQRARKRAGDGESAAAVERAGDRMQGGRFSENKAANLKKTTLVIFPVTFLSTNKHTSSRTCWEAPGFNWMQPEARFIPPWPVSGPLVDEAHDKAAVVA